MRFVLVLVTLAASPALWSCSCLGDGSPCMAAGRSAAVFIGTVQDITEPRAPAPSHDAASGQISSSRRGAGPATHLLPWPKRTVVLRVSEALSGVPAGQADITIATGLGGGDCGFPFQRGGEYVVYAFRNSEGQLEANICSRTRQLAAAAEDVRYIRERTHAPATGEIRVVTAVPGHSPRSGEPVVAEAVGMQYRASTDAAGVATFHGMPPGEYGIAFEGSSDKTTIQLFEKGCRQITLLRVLRVTGRVTNAYGEGARRLQVQAQTMDGKVETVAMTGRDGTYELRISRPGRYRIAIEHNPQWFHPGASDEAAATVVEFTGDADTRSMDLALPSPSAP